MGARNKRIYVTDVSSIKPMGGGLDVKPVLTPPTSRRCVDLQYCCSKLPDSESAGDRIAKPVRVRKAGYPTH